MMRCTSRIVRLVSVVMTATVLTYGNQPPVVNAGADQTNVSLAGFTRLSGTVSDDSTAFESLTIRWIQLSGAPAVITLTDFPNTTVQYPDSGVYVFELRASDGTFSAADTIMVKVRLALPFKVLAPEENGSVEIGKPYLIRWQMDPSKPCMVYLSVDDGLTWKILSETGSVSDSLRWTPMADSGVTDGTVALLKVAEYQNENNFAQTSLLFSKPGSMAVLARTGAGSDWCGGFRPSRSVAGRAVDGGLNRTTVFDTQGRCVAEPMRSTGIEIDIPNLRR